MNDVGSDSSRSDPSLTGRMDELETRLAFLDDTLAALNEVVAAHDRHLLQAVDEMKRLRGDLQALRGALSPDPREEPPPPHY